MTRSKIAFFLLGLAMLATVFSVVCTTPVQSRNLLWSLALQTKSAHPPALASAEAFTLPVHYEQVKPSEAYLQRLTRKGVSASDVNLTIFLAEDADYEKKKVDLATWNK